MLSHKDIQGLYAIIPTPALPGADRWDAQDTVDLAETERLLNALIRDGSDGIIALGTTGECATLSQRDYEAFAACVVKVVNRRVPVFVGATALGTHEIVRRLKFVRDLGADGTMLGLPMWQPLTNEMAVRYYGSISEAFPDLAVMVYANTRAFRFDFAPDFWGAVAKQAPTLVAAKCSRPTGLKEMIANTGGRVNFIPNDMTIQDFYALSPQTTTACWATAASMGPQPSIAITKAVRAGDAQRIKSLAADIAWANQPIEAIVGDPKVMASYNIQMEKVRINEAGYCNSGPVRPPYDYMPPELEARSKECGRRWAELCRRLAGSGREAAASRA